MKRTLLNIILGLFAGSLLAQDNIIPLNLTEVYDDNSVYRQYRGKVLFEIPSNGLTRFDIRSGAGEVEITPSSLPVITVEAEVELSSASKKKASKFLARDLKLSLDRKGDRARLVSFFTYTHKKRKNHETFDPIDFFRTPERRVNLKIKVPENLFIDVNDNSGDLIIANLRNDLDIDDGSGLLYINNVDGELKIYDNSGDIVIKNINQRDPAPHKLNLVDHSGGIRLEKVRADVTISDNSGDIRAEEVTGSVKIVDASGEIRLKEIEGDVELDDASGEIISRTVTGNMVISDASGGIYVRDVFLDVNIKSAGAGDLSLEEIKGDITGDLRKLRY